MDEWINRMWHIHTIGHYLVIRMNDLLILTIRYMNFANIILNETS